MKQQDFEQTYASAWDAFQQYIKNKPSKSLFSRKNKKSWDSTTPFTEAEFPTRYKAICHNLALARARGYSDHLITHLNRLVVAGHHQLYGANAKQTRYWVKNLLYGFPITLRNNAKFVWVSTIAFVLPFLLIAIACYQNNDMIYSLMEPAQVKGMEAMYSENSRAFGRERASDSNILMFGIYIKNNIGISFRSFAGGIFFGIGSLFFMIFNGLVIGGITGHLTQLGYGQNFYSFVAGHGAFELSAIVFSGAAGLMLGYALLAPGGRSRKTALRNAGREAAWLIYGTTVMLLIAAFIEAFWSSKTDVAPMIKYIIGIIFWVLVISYCTLAGRKHNATR